MFSLAQAQKALVEGEIADAALRGRFEKTRHRHRTVW